VDEALGALRGHSRDRVIAAETLAAAAQGFAKEAVDAFAEGGDDQHLIAERLAAFGSLVVSPLRYVLSQSRDRDTRFLAAVCLLYNGDAYGFEELFVALDEGDRWAAAAVRAIGDNRVVHATLRLERLAEKIDLTDESNVPLVTNLVSALRTLGKGSLPAGFRERLEGVEPEWRRQGWLGDR